MSSVPVNATTAVVILAAGKGSRMRSSLAKVLHDLCGRSLLNRVLDTARQLEPKQVLVVLAEDQGEIRERIATDYGTDIDCVIQPKQLGTGHAVGCALASLQPDIRRVLVLYADVPLITQQILQDILATSCADSLTDAFVLLTTDCPDRSNVYGRIIHDDLGKVQEIVEFKDCQTWQKDILRVSSGVMCIPAKQAQAWLKEIKPNNQQGEYYLTDLVALAQAQAWPIVEISTDFDNVVGVNTMMDLARLEGLYNQRIAQSLLSQGVRLNDPRRFDCRGQLSCGKDVRIDINCIFEGQVTLGDDVQIGANCQLKNCQIDSGTIIKPNSIIEDAIIAQSVSIGPFARIRPGTRIDDGARVGNFVEVKNSHLHKGVKASHLSYLGDSELGQDCNVGAGTITCNYDGVSKKRTEIGERVFVGSGTQFIAPVKVGDDVIIGAGTTVRCDVEKDSLLVSKPEQRKVKNYSSRYWRKRAKPDPSE